MAAAMVTGLSGDLSVRAVGAGELCIQVQHPTGPGLHLYIGRDEAAILVELLTEQLTPPDAPIDYALVGDQQREAVSHAD